MEGDIDAVGDAPENPYECLELDSDSDPHTLRMAYDRYIERWESFMPDRPSMLAQRVYYVRDRMRGAWADIAAIRTGLGDLFQEPTWKTFDPSRSVGHPGICQRNDDPYVHFKDESGCAF